MSAALRMAEQMLIYPNRRLDDGGDGPGLHSTSPLRRRIATKMQENDRLYPGRNGMVFLGRLHNNVIPESYKPGDGCDDA